MALVRLLFWAHLMSGVLVPFFREWGRLSYTQMFAVQAWFMLANFLFEVPTGAVADRFGRRASVALGGLVVGVASLVYASVPSLAVFLACETLFAIGLTLMSGADEALVYDSLAALGRAGEATRVLARLEAWKLGGIFGGALLGSLVAARFGVRAPLLVQALPMTLSGLVALTLREPPRGERVPAEGRRYLRLVSGGLLHLRRAPALRALAADQVAGGAIGMLSLWLYQPQLMRAGVPIALFGLVHAAMGLGQIALLSRLAPVERLAGGRVRVLRATAILGPLCVLALAATTNGALSCILVIVAVVATMGRAPLFSGALNARIPSEQRATVLSAVSAARTLTIALLYPLVGMLADRSLAGTFAAVGLLGLAAAVTTAAPAALFADAPPRAEPA